MSALIPIYRQLAADGTNFRGLSILQHRKQLAQLCRQHKAKKLLDYGCGAGDAWRTPHRLHKDFGLHWFDVTLFDPAFPEHDERPFGLFDGVLCSDVLEHVPEADDQLDEVIRDLFAFSRGFVWASICCRPAKKAFPDGTNMHVTLHPMAWWQAKFKALAPTGRTVIYYLVETP